MLVVTSIYAALGALLAAGLAGNVIRLRRRYAVGLYDGGHKDLGLAIRAHANLVESLPLVLVLLGLLELREAPALALHVGGVAYLLGRLMHAATMTRTDAAKIGRTAGTALTLTSLVVGAGGLLYTAIGAGL